MIGPVESTPHHMPSSITAFDVTGSESLELGVEIAAVDGSEVGVDGDDAGADGLRRGAGADEHPDGTRSAITVVITAAAAVLPYRHPTLPPARTPAMAR